MFNRKALRLEIFVASTFMIASCGGADLENSNPTSSPQAPSAAEKLALGSSSPTNTYRLLTSVRNRQSFSVTDDEFASACERLLGFSRTMTSARVVSAREIEIPLQTIEETAKEVSVAKPRKVKVRPESSGEIIYEPEEKVIFEESGSEERIFRKYFDGLCIGTEYITE